MNQMQSPPLVAEACADGVLTLSLGAAPAHPLSRAMIEALDGALAKAAADEDVRVVLIHGAGRIFCAGHDLKEIARHRGDADHGTAFLTDLFEACSAMMLRLARLPKPTIAACEGIATAAGLQLLASCDIAIVGPSATFCLPGIKNGGFCTTPAVAVSRGVGQKALMELMLTGEALDADWALRTGLITRVEVDPLAKAQAMAATLATRNPGPVAAGKAALHAHLGTPLEEAYAIATPVMVSHFLDKGRLKAEGEDGRWR
ncbi:MAG: enoyl-CoA hydratase-related protein [Pseudomonadota bacterium]